MRKRALIVFTYLSVIMMILAANHNRWFSKQSHQKNTLISSANAFIPTFSASETQDPNINRSWVLKDNEAINIQKAWKLSQGDKRIVVAIIDTGIDYKHPDLKANLWNNKNEIAGNGIDDDKNGFIDDMMGWNFVRNNALPNDTHGHGTHIAGIIGAVKGNDVGIAGISPNVSLMILKYYSPTATGRKNLDNTIKAFKYAVDNGAHIINYSGGGAEYSKEEHDMIALAQKKGILIVAAAGNERQNADVHAYYPASYDLDNIISVAAVRQDKTLVSSSNFGIRKIDVAAPGHRIYSTLPKGRYGYMTGTSQATAIITGIAALALSKYGKLPAVKIKNLLVKSIDPLKSLAGKIKSGGMVNAHTVLLNASSDETTTF